MELSSPMIQIKVCYARHITKYISSPSGCGMDKKSFSKPVCVGSAASSLPETAAVISRLGLQGSLPIPPIHLRTGHTQYGKKHLYDHFHAHYLLMEAMYFLQIKSISLSALLPRRQGTHSFSENVWTMDFFCQYPGGDALSRIPH